MHLSQRCTEIRRNATVFRHLRHPPGWAGDIPQMPEDETVKLVPLCGADLVPSCGVSRNPNCATRDISYTSTHTTTTKKQTKWASLSFSRDPLPATPAGLLPSLPPARTPT